MSGAPHTMISVDAPVVTLINVFTVVPRRQAELVEALNHATTAIFVNIPGFHSANIHASLDGTRVVNYAQWASPEHFEAMLNRRDVQQHLKEIMAIAENAEPRLFTVRAVHNIEFIAR
jgi:heme-degrading monooxygenase HmoA